MTNYLPTLIFFSLLLLGAGVSALIGQTHPDAAVLVGLAWLMVDVIISNGVRLAAQWERGVVFRLGKYLETRGPGLFLIIPIVDTVTLVDTRIRAMDIPSQQVITKDNVPVKINGVIYFRVDKVEDAIIKVQDYRYAISQYAQTALRDVIGQMSLDQLLSEREQIGKMIKKAVVDDTVGWGLEVTGINIQDIDMPEDLKKMMSRQASITKAQGDREAADNLAGAADTMLKSPGAMQLRTLQSIDGLGNSASNTVIIAVPVELMELVKALAIKASRPAD
jgi:regulator of protease activity HflC (stomatin/prohibitin superfamily)